MGDELEHHAAAMHDGRRSYRVDPATGAQQPLRIGAYLTDDLHWRGAVDATYSWAAGLRSPSR